jgi:hypothetical protein
MWVAFVDGESSAAAMPPQLQHRIRGALSAAGFESTGRKTSSGDYKVQRRDCLRPCAARARIAPYVGKKRGASRWSKPHLGALCKSYLTIVTVCKPPIKLCDRTVNPAYPLMVPLEALDVA